MDGEESDSLTDFLVRRAAGTLVASYFNIARVAPLVGEVPGA